jgi:hypothetical protein
MDNQQIVGELLFISGDVALKWLKWKQHHNYMDLMMRCCEDSANLFDALEQLTKQLREAGILKRGENDG